MIVVGVCAALSGLIVAGVVVTTVLPPAVAAGILPLVGPSRRRGRGRRPRP